MQRLRISMQAQVELPSNKEELCVPVPAWLRICPAHDRPEYVQSASGRNAKTNSAIAQVVACYMCPNVCHPNIIVLQMVMSLMSYHLSPTQLLVFVDPN